MSTDKKDVASELAYLRQALPHLTLEPSDMNYLSHHHHHAATARSPSPDARKQAREADAAELKHEPGHGAPELVVLESNRALISLLADELAELNRAHAEYGDTLRSKGWVREAAQKEAGERAKKQAKAKREAERKEKVSQRRFPFCHAWMGFRTLTVAAPWLTGACGGGGDEEAQKGRKEAGERQQEGAGGAGAKGEGGGATARGRERARSGARGCEAEG